MPNLKTSVTNMLQEYDYTPIRTWSKVLSCAMQASTLANGPVKGPVGTGSPTEVLKTAKKSTERAAYSKDEVDVITYVKTSKELYNAVKV